MMSENSSELIWSNDKREVTFYRRGVESRIEGFIERVRRTLPVLGGKLPADKSGVEALANAEWLSREEYSGIFRDQAFKLVENKHFIQDVSSGTTGEPVIRYHAWTDELSEQLMTRRCFELLDMGPDDRLVVLEIGAPDIATFYFRAFAELGVRDRCFLHVSTDFLGSIEPLERLDPTIILTVPGVLARCWPRFAEMYDGKRERSLRAVIHYAEPLSDDLRAKLDVGSYSFYGTTELGGTASECHEHRGMHVMDDWILPTLREVKESSPGVYTGEVGWTTMHYSAMPLQKYAVGDQVRIDTNPCPCGYPGVLMTFLQRTHDVVSVYGLKFSFKSIERALSEVLGPDPLVQLLLDDVPEGTAMTVQVCRDHEVEAQKVTDALYEVFEFDEMLEMGYLTVKVERVDRSCFDQRKLRRVVDRRSDTPYG